MSKLPRFSVITPTLNRRGTLLRAIRSVQAQTLPDYEHLIIDDGSHDGTEELVKSLADSRIRYFRFPERRGANLARNWGIAEARAEWLTFLDSDDEFLPQRLAALDQACNASSHLPLLISSFQTCKRGKISNSINPQVALSGPELERGLCCYGLCIAGTSITVRREALRQVGGFAPRLKRLQDRDVLLRLSQHGGARLLAAVDWIKHPSPDSISAPRSGYIASLGALLAEHPQAARRHREALAYQVARHLLADMLRGRWRAVRESLNENRAAESLGFSWEELLASYLFHTAGKRDFARTLARKLALAAGRNKESLTRAADQVAPCSPVAVNRALAG